jgi:predicted RNA binding protein YcfA (HicA-like mRNA interferase family)
VPKLPIISGRKAIKIFQKIGYQVVRQKGSHIRLHHKEKDPITIPDYKTISRGLLRKVLRDAQLTREKFLQLLRKK